jgi:hypothetical protein
LDAYDEITADLFECDNYYVFDPSAPQFQYCRLTMNRYCITAGCAGVAKSVIMNYPYFPQSRGQFIATCRKDATKPPIITRCDAGFIADLNAIPVECKLQCRGATKAPFPGDPQKYYECVYTGRIYEAKEKSCFRNYIFDEKTKQCKVNPNPTPPTTSTTVAPTAAPTGAPTDAPTGAPTGVPTGAPTAAPTGAPTDAPTGAPTGVPTVAPTGAPTGAPTEAPTGAPTGAPTDAPTGAPTGAPTDPPTDPPTGAPTDPPTDPPTGAPTDPPTDPPTGAPGS